MTHPSLIASWIIVPLTAAHFRAYCSLTTTTSFPGARSLVPPSGEGPHGDDRCRRESFPSGTDHTSQLFYGCGLGGTATDSVVGDPVAVLRLTVLGVPLVISYTLFFTGTDCVEPSASVTVTVESSFGASPNTNGAPFSVSVSRVI